MRVKGQGIHCPCPGHDHGHSPDPIGVIMLSHRCPGSYDYMGQPLHEMSNEVGQSQRLYFPHPRLLVGEALVGDVRE